jgi:uncharacterized RDD family membrane protein YckC
LVRIDRVALGPVRAAARSGRGLLADETERAIGAVLAGSLPEVLARSLAEYRVVERVVVELLETPAPDVADGNQFERLVEEILNTRALERWAGTPEAGRVAEIVAAQVLRSVAFRQAMTEFLSSREFRQAISGQTTGFAAELAAAARRRARSFDDSLEARVRRLLRRPRDERQPLRFAGLGTRGLGLVVDAALAQLAFTLGAASVALVAELAGALRPDWLVWTLSGLAWLLVAGFYFVGFWSVTGQTPGMRIMCLRVTTSSGELPSLPRSVVRFAGLILAILPLFAGFLPVLVDSRRRALHDFLAGTLVVYERGPGENVASDGP